MSYESVVVLGQRMILNQILQRRPPLQLVRHCTLAIILRIHLQILNDIVQQMSSFTCGAEFVLKTSKVYVEMIKLRQIMYKDTDLIRLNTIGGVDGR